SLGLGDDHRFGSGGGEPFDHPPLRGVVARVLHTPVGDQLFVADLEHPEWAAAQVGVELLAVHVSHRVHPGRSQVDGEPAVEVDGEGVRGAAAGEHAQPRTYGVLQRLGEQVVDLVAAEVGGAGFRDLDSLPVPSVVDVGGGRPLGGDGGEVHAVGSHQPTHDHAGFTAHRGDEDRPLAQLPHQAGDPVPLAAQMEVDVVEALAA